MASALSDIVSRFDKWFIAFLVFLLFFATFMLLYLDYAPVRWDETPHLYGGLLLSRGQFDGFLRENAFYPPLFDVTTALFFTGFGVSMFSARLVAVTFSLLSLLVVFEYAKKLYGQRTALLSVVLLAAMPGFIWLSRMAIIETMLMFFFTISMFLFFLWMHTKKDRMLLFTGITLGLGFLVKYQIVIGGIIILISLLYFVKQRLSFKLSKFLLVLIVAVLVISPWILLVYQQYASDMIGKWIYVMGMGNEERLAYSTRFPMPIFYLIEMTQPYPHRHPIALPLYLLALVGLVLWMWRRNESDKFSLITFAAVYIIFTIITSKDWRYITLIFPILSVSASELIVFLWDKIVERLKLVDINFADKNLTKVVAGALVVFVGASLAYSAWEAYLWVEFDYVNIPIDEASKYVVERVTPEEKIIVLCGGNYFSADMVEYYLLVYDPNQEQPVQYPDLPVDAYTPEFNYTELIETSEATNVKYLLLFEHGNITYYDSELRYSDVLDDMLETNRFTIELTLGASPRRIFVLRFS